MIFDDDYLKRCQLYAHVLIRRAGVFLREIRPGVFAWRCVMGHTHYSEMQLAMRPDGEFGMTMKDLPDEPQEHVSEEQETRTTAVPEYVRKAFGEE